MYHKLILTAIVLSVFVGSFLAKGRFSDSHRRATEKLTCERIVSMAPSITETLFALGLGDRVVGVTPFCEYPPEAKEIARIGAYLDPNLEAVLSLDPDLVVMLVENGQTTPALHKLGLNTLTVCHQNVEGTLASITKIGRKCGATDEARELVAGLRARMQRVQRKTAGLPRLRVLFAIERTPGSGTLEDVYIAGAGGYFDKIITLAGGQNAHRDRTVASPVVSAEGIMKMNPQVILDLVVNLDQGRHDPATLLADWQGLARVEAVADGRVHLVEADYFTKPGPRFILLLEDLARMLHPEVDWERED